uniref:ascorbate ferrireductase (transmembrane) n=1 Tax=Anopheles funestus TaxID=62324 RepID=A0A182RWP8_ANOFN
MVGHRNYRTRTSAPSLVDRSRWLYLLCGGHCAGDLLPGSTNRRHFSSTHSIVGLISLVFLVLTLANGLMALFAIELRKRIRPIYSKLSHYLTGTVCYVLGMVAIVLAYEKRIYRQNTVTEGITMMTVFTIAVTVLSMVGVVKTIYNQLRTLAK